MTEDESDLAWFDALEAFKAAPGVEKSLQLKMFDGKTKPWATELDGLVTIVACEKPYLLFEFTPEVARRVAVEMLVAAKVAEESK